MMVLYTQVIMLFGVLSRIASCAQAETWSEHSKNRHQAIHPILFETGEYSC